MNRYQWSEVFARLVTEKLAYAKEIEDFHLPGGCNQFPYTLRKLEWNRKLIDHFLVYRDYYDFETEPENKGTDFVMTRNPIPDWLNPLQTMLEIVSSVLFSDLHESYPSFQKIVVFADGDEVFSIPLELFIKIERMVESEWSQDHVSRFNSRNGAIGIITKHILKACYGASLVEIFFPDSEMFSSLAIGASKLWSIDPEDEDVILTQNTWENTV